MIVARAILNSSLWKMRLEDRIVAITCMALCNKRPKKWFDGVESIIIQRGQFVRSREQMAKACEMSVQAVRTSIEHLEECEFLTRTLTRAYTLYTIPKYMHYQDLTKYSDSGVRKPTRVLTRSQPGKTPKSNPTFSRAPIRNPIDSKGVAGVLVNCGENLTSEISKSNHKQQQQTKTKSESAAKPDRNGLGDSVVVVPEGTTDPILEKISVRISMDLLASIKMEDSVAHAFAATKSVGTILGVVQQARLQKKPAGWARSSLEKGWRQPDAAGPELQEIIDKVKADVEHSNSRFVRKAMGSGIKLETERRPGEDERTWLKRVTDELNRKKQGAGSGRREKGT